MSCAIVFGENDPCAGNLFHVSKFSRLPFILQIKDHSRKLESLHSELKFRWGIHVGDAPKLILYCKPLIGRKYMFRGHDQVSFQKEEKETPSRAESKKLCSKCFSNPQVTIEKQWSDTDVPVLHNTIISDLEEHETEVANFKTLEEVFVENTPVFLMTLNEYGLQVSLMD